MTSPFSLRRFLSAGAAPLQLLDPESDPGTGLRGLARVVRGRMVARTTLAIVVLSALVGLLVAILSMVFVERLERERLGDSLRQSLAMVERTAGIAAFVGDQTLAAEVARGLAQNPAVACASIRAGDQVLAQAGSCDTARQRLAASLVRPLISPFDPKQVVGSIELVPAQQEIRRQAATYSNAIALILALQIAAMSVAVAWVVLHMVTRPIKRISDDLHDLSAAAGRALVPPPGCEHDEIGRLVADINALAARLRARETVYSAIVNQAADAICLIDETTRRFVEFNEVAHSALGYSREEFAELGVLDIDVHPDAARAHMAAVRSSGSDEFETRHRRRDGSTVNVRVASRMIAIGDRRYGLTIWSDISERKRAQEELRGHRDRLQQMVNERTRDLLLAKDAAEAANIAKSEFLANMSHELRTPMHGILSFARLGRDRIAVAPLDKLERYFESIVASGERLLRLLNDLLDLSKLEAGKMTMELAERDMYEIAAATVADFRPLGAERQLVLEVRRATDDVLLTCDAQRLRQVLANLLSNAIKFSPACGRVDVSLEAEPASDNRGGGARPALLLKVSDQGPGIPEDELEAVFDKFVQLTKTRSGAGGTGLGLSIARAIVHQHGGTIRASNNVQGGACFIVLLPRASLKPAALDP